MSKTRDYFGASFAGGTVTLLARVEDAEGQALTSSDAAAVTYRIDARDPCEPGSATPVSGHEDQPLDPSAVLYDTLQTGAPWDIDATGYNFRHEIDVATSPAFPTAGRTYSVTYVLTTTGGQPIVFRFLIEAI